MTVKQHIEPYWKAILGFLAPAAVVLIGAVTSASDGGSTITAAEWVTAACTAIVTGAGVWAIPNRPSGSVPDRTP